MKSREKLRNFLKSDGSKDEDLTTSLPKRTESVEGRKEDTEVIDSETDVVTPVSPVDPSKLFHRTIFEDKSRIQVELPLIESLKSYHRVGGGFPLVSDPLVTRKTSIVGMFVLRPSVENWTDPVVDDAGNMSMYDVSGGWAFNFTGLDGGWLIANSNTVDAFRLGLQYAISGEKLKNLHS